MLYLLLGAVLTQDATRPAGRQFPLLVAEEVFQATVLSIEDGDTMNVRAVASGEASVIHVVGVDAPELSQPGGAEAKAFLAGLVSGKTITVRLKAALERFAQVEIDGSDVSFLLIRNGMAWHCPRFAKEEGLTAAEAEARRAKRGIWSRPQPTPPWIYRGAGVCWEKQKAPARRVRQHGRALSIVSQSLASVAVSRPVECGHRRKLPSPSGRRSRAPMDAHP